MEGRNQRLQLRACRVNVVAIQRIGFGVLLDDEVQPQSGSETEGIVVVPGRRCRLLPPSQHLNKRGLRCLGYDWESYESGACVIGLVGASNRGVREEGRD
jgi:hypothetical protein